MSDRRTHWAAAPILAQTLLQQWDAEDAGRLETAAWFEWRASIADEVRQEWDVPSVWG